MNDVIFREYDIRGKVGSELILDQVYDLTRAIIAYCIQHNPHIKSFAIGMDGRTHSSHIKQEMCRAFVDSGIDVQFIGVCTSPVLYFALHTLPVDGGLMITASHNAKEYNGIKICLGKNVVWGKELKVINQMYREKRAVKASKKGMIHDYEIIPSYINWLSSHFAHLKNMPLSAVVDCGNGAAGTVLPALTRAMGWQKVQLLYEEVDGTYPNHEADPTVAANMADVKNMLAQSNVQLGIGLDGDCDRMVPMTKEGSLVPGDQLLAVFAQQVLEQNRGASVVFDVKSSSGLVELLVRWGAKPIMSPAGHAIIKDMMKKHGALLGGELSCHFFFYDRYFGYDDGVYAMLRLFEIIHSSDKTLTELLACFPTKYSSREMRVICDEAKKNTIVDAMKKHFSMRNDVTMVTIDGIRVTMPYGWGIIRASNTQPALSIRCESDSRIGLIHVLQDFIDALRAHLVPDAIAELEQERDVA